MGLSQIILIIIICFLGSRLNHFKGPVSIGIIDPKTVCIIVIVPPVFLADKIR